jgi:hypothetical protein
MTLLSFLGNIVATPIVMSIVGIRHLLEVATCTLERIEKMIRTPDRDVQIEQLKTRIDQLEALVQSRNE